MFLSCRDEREEGNSYIISFLHPGGPFIMGYPMPSLAGLAGPFLPPPPHIRPGRMKRKNDNNNMKIILFHCYYG